MKPKKKYLVKVYGGGNGRTLVKTYECDTLKEARAQRALLQRYLQFYMNIIIDSVPLNEDEINSASAASQRRKEQHGNPEKK